MAEQMRVGEKVTKDELINIGRELLGAKNIAKEVSGTATVEFSEKGGKQLLSLTTELNNALREYQNLVLKKSTVGSKAKGYFGTEEKMINDLKTAWNEYVKDVQNGQVDMNNLHKSESAKKVLLKANALDALTSINRNEFDDNGQLKIYTESVKNVNEEIYTFVQQMRELKAINSQGQQYSPFAEGGYNSDITHFVEAFKPVKKIFDEIKVAKESLGMTSEQINSLLSSINLEKYDQIESKVEHILSLGQQRRATGTSSDEMNAAAAEAESAADRMEDSAERAKKAYETIAEIREKARQKYNQDRFPIETDDDYYSANANYEDDIKSGENRLKELTRIAKSLEEKKQQIESDLKFDERGYQAAVDSGDTSNVNSWGSQIEEHYQELLKYQDLIEYIQKELQTSLSNFKPGDSWGAEEIQAVIGLLQNLQHVLNDISECFVKIEDNNVFSSIGQSAEKINEMFNADKIQAFNAQLADMVQNLTDINAKTGTAPINVNMPGDSNVVTEEKENYLRQQYARYKRAYDRVMTAANKSARKVSGTTGQDYLFSQLLNNRQVVDAFGDQDSLRELYSETSFENKDVPYMQRIEALQQFFKYLKLARKEAKGDQNFWKEISKISLPSSDPTRINKALNNIQNGNINAEDANGQAMDALSKMLPKEAFASSEEYQKLFNVIKEIRDVLQGGIDVTSFETLLDLVSNLIPKFEELNTLIKNIDLSNTFSSDAFNDISSILKEGFGIKDNGELSYLEQLTSQLREFIDLAKQANNIPDNNVADSAKETQAATEVAAEGIGEEGEAAAKAAPNKERMAEANEQLASSEQKTGQSAKEASNGLNAEGDAAQDAAGKIKQAGDASEETNEEIKSGIYKNQHNMVESSGGWTETEKIGFATEKTTIHGYDKEGNETTIENYLPNYEKLENEIIKVDSAILKLQHDIEDTEAKGISTDGLTAQLEAKEKYLEKLLEEYKKYIEEPEYAPGNTQNTNLENKREQNRQEILNKRKQELANREAKARQQEDRAEQKVRQQEDIARQKARQQEDKAEQDRIKNNQKIYDQYLNDRAKEEANQSRAQQEAQRRYADGLQRIQELGKANTQQLNAEIKNAQSGNALEEMASAVEKVTEKENEAKEAMRELFSMYRNGDISKQQWQDALSLYQSDDVKVGSASARDKRTNFVDGIFKSTQQRFEKAKGADVSLDLGGWRPQGWAEEMDRLLAKVEELKTKASSINFSSPEAAGEIQNIRDELQKVNAEYANLSKQDQWKPVDSTWSDSFTTKVAKWMDENKIAAKEFNDQLQEVRDSIKGVGSEAEASTVENMFSNIQTEAADKGLLGKSLGDRFRDQFKNTMTSLATYYLSFQDFIRYGREAIEVVTQLDTAMTELKKVSSESAQTYNNFLQGSFDIADQVGGTAEQIIQSTAAWKRLGKSFAESQEAAQASVKLLNVSEFENIDDATTSLVSMKQAFKDNTYDEFIDKLNGVGDSFSSSTDQIAYGMRNVSAVLKVAGNDIDQSIALLTAANDITQDMSKASMGVRTVALRLAGTEAAKEELAESGEDVSDFVVQTASKVDSQIRMLTATAANPNGISVLDDSGRLRDTYDILLDIAKIWDQILEKDNEFGTNSSNALLELMAGKTRSNILASILQSPEILESAYKTSQNSEGIGQRELDIYLDSVQAKTTQLQNRLQELASTALSSDTLKGFIEALTHVLELVNSIVDKFGMLPTIIGAASGFFMQRNGFGALATKFGVAKNASGKGEGWTALLSGMFGSEPETSLVEKTIVKPLSEELQGVFDMMDPEGDLGVQLNSLGIDGELFDSIKEGIGDLDIESITAGDALHELTTETIQVEEAAQGAGSVFSGFSAGLGKIGGVIKNVAAGVASMAVNFAVITAVTAAIGLLIDGIIKLATAHQRAIDAGKEAQESIKATNQQYSDTVQSISEVKDEYAKLSTGVDAAGKNVNLSGEEYARFLEISGQLAEIAPELVTGYDEQGNALVNLGNTVEGVNSKFEEYLNAQRDIANFDIGSKLDTVYAGITAQVKDYTSDLHKAEEDLKQAKEDLGEETPENGFQILGAQTGMGIVKNGKISGYQTISQRQVTQDTQFITISEDDVQALQNVLPDAQMWEPEIGSTTRTFAVDLSNASQDLLDALNHINRGSETSAVKNKNLSEANIKKYELAISAEYNKIIPAIQNYIDTTPFFDELNTKELQDKYRNAFASIFGNLDYSDFVDDIEEIGGVENFVDDFITTMMANDDTQEAFEKLIDLQENRAKMTMREYQEAKQEQYKVIQDAFIDYSTGESIYSTEYLDAFLGDDMQQRERDAARKLGITSEKEQDEFISILHQAKIENEENLLHEIETMSQKKAGAFDGVWKKILEYINPYLTGEIEPKKIKPNGTLAEMFANEEYSDNAEKYQSNLSSLSGALETLRTEGALTAEAMADLQESFPDLTEFTTESLQTKAFEELDKWIQEIRSHMDGMSEEEIKQAETYIQNLVDSYGDLNVSMKDVRDSYFESFMQKNPGASIGMAQKEEAVFNKQVTQLEGALKATGQELDYHVLYTLVAQDEFSGTAEEIFDKYNDLKVNWALTLENENIEKDIEKQQVKLENAQAIRNTKSANGEVIAPGDYDIELSSLRGIAEDRRQQASNAWDIYASRTGTERENAEQNWIKAETAARQAEAEALQLEKESIESETNELQAAVREQDNAVTEAENAIAKAEAQYGEGMADQKLYDNLAEAQLARAMAKADLSSKWEEIATKYAEEHPEWAAEWMGSALSESADSQSDAQSAKANNTINQRQKLNTLQEQATQLQRNLTVAEQKHQKVSKSTYQDLIRNAKEQIKSLREEQNEARDNLSEWRNYQDQIDSLNDSIYDWQSSIDSLVFDQAKTLSDSLWSAMSESMSDTGLTNETIDALVTAFSDISGKEFDVSDAFYNTAEGVKVNVSALQELTEAEYDMIAANLEEEIYNIQDAMGNFDEGSTMWNLYNDQLQTLMQSQSQFFAQYQSMERALSHSNLMELAEGRENQGARYDENYERYGKYKEAYENGLVGTDDFKEWTAYLDEWGRNTYEAYEAAKGKAERYFTEDASTGMENFLRDLEALGLAEQDAEGYWAVKVDDMNEAAHRMGMGAEFFEDMFGKLGEYDFVTDILGSETERQLKVSGLQGDLAKEVQIYNDMLQNGATTKELQEQLNTINGIGDRIESINQLAADFAASEEGNRKEEFLGLDERLKGLQEAYNAEGATEETKSAIADQARKDARTYGYALNEESLKEKGEIQLSPSDLIDYQSRMPELDFDSIRESIGKQMQELGKGGSVDLLSRPMIDAAKLVEAGWEDAGEGIATVFSSTFSNADETIAMNFTPIITDENGNYKGVLSPDELQQYAEGVIDGVREDDLHLQMGTAFTGEDAIDQAVAAAEQIHNLQDSYYLGLDSFKQYYNENTEAATNYLSVLSKFDRKTLEQVSLNNGNYEIDKEAEDALQGLADATGYTNENISQLLDLLGLLNVDLSKVELPEAAKTDMDRLEEFLSTTQKESGAGYNISTNVEGLTDEQLTSQLQNITQLQATLSPDSEVYQQLEQLKSDTQLQLDISAILQSGDFTVEDIRQLISSGASKEQIATAIGVDISDPAGLAKVEQVMQMAEQGYEMTVHVDDAQFRDLMEAITGEPYEATVEVNADTSEAEREADQLKRTIERKPVTQKVVQKIQKMTSQETQAKASTWVASKQPSKPQTTTATASMDVSGAQKGAKQFDKIVSKANSETATAKADLDVSGALTKIAILKGELDSVGSTQVTPVINTSNIEHAINRTITLIQRLDAAAQKKASVALGTAHTLGTAHATGTTRVAGAKLSHAYVSGSQDWTVGQDEDALVNEIGQESRVHDGVWELLPGGPHVEHLDKDDIIFNAEQTEDLLRTGKTARNGRLVSYAKGTFDGMSAFSRNKAGKTGGKIKKGSSSGGGKNNSSGGRNRGGNNGGKGKSSKKTKKTNPLLDKFSKYLEKLFDWIEVRLDRIQRRIDLFTAQAENAIGFGTKNAKINSAMGQIARDAGEVSRVTIQRDANGTVTGQSGAVEGTLLSDSALGAVRYQQQANAVLAAAQKKNKKGKSLINSKQAADIADKVARGVIDINSYPEKIRKVIEAYKEW